MSRPLPALPSDQDDLFGAPMSARQPASLPGLRHEADFLSHDEEASLIALVQRLPLEEARYREHVARRRVMSFGGSFDYDSNRLQPAEPLVPELHGLRDRVARWMDVAPQALVHALVAEYQPGVQLGWHRDVPDFERVAGVSLGGWATLRFRPRPPYWPRRGGILRLPLPPRSIYLMEGPARWDWQHSLAAVEELRWSITFRTARW